MRQRKKPWSFLIIGLLSLTGFIYLLLNFSPDSSLQIFGFDLPMIPLFLFSIFVFISFFFGYVFNNLRRGVFLGLIAGIYLFLRLNHLTQIFFLVLLIILFIILEIIFNNAE